MDCSRYRDALSAALDGEDPGLPLEQAERHCRSCLDCEAWYTRVSALDRVVRVRPADQVPDLVPAIAARLDVDRSARWWEPAWPWRVTLAVVGVVQVLQGLPVMIIGSDGANHMAHELGAWGVALGAGFVYAAWRPARAAGMLPFVGALVAFLFVTTTRDVLVGNAGAADELAHLFEAFGLLLLWAVARVGRSGHALPLRRGLHPV